MLMWKAAALAPLAAFSLVSATPPEELYTNNSAVVQVWCDRSAGTAFVVDGHIVSVAHVTNEPGCSIWGVPIHGKQEPGKDFSIIADSMVLRGLKVNCEGFKPGRWYFAVGYANAVPLQRVIRLQATGFYDPATGEAILDGNPTVIPGMSGGPILNERAEVVGTTNMYQPEGHLSFSVELKDTQLCR